VTLAGQWISRYQGSNSGTIVIDIEEYDDRYKGVACVWDDDLPRPSSLVRFITNSREPTQTLSKVKIVPMWRTGRYLLPDELSKLSQEGFSFPSDAEISFGYQDSSLSVTWTTSVNTDDTTTAVLAKTTGGAPSALVPLRVSTWGAFKKYIDTLPAHRYAFRGQENSKWRLRTTFHRSKRKILERFLVDDVLELRKAFSGAAAYKFNIDDPLDYAAFLKLAQHHGYPTPLLDWTLSPYVAAFFVFRNLRGGFRRTDKVRIFKFGSYQWNLTIPRFETVFPALPHVSLLDALALGNPRAIPQQGLSMITNVDDIETHIASVEQSRKLTFLEAIDLPASARPEVMRDLAFMGITAGSLFPGLDGVCESLREKNFS
jgi:hypothetical protein